MNKISIQGIKGSFHHYLLIKVSWKNNYEIIECKNFNQLAQTISNKEANLGLMAINNGIIGNIIYNYILLLSYKILILGVMSLYIDQHLITCTKKSVSEILSHTIALRQCNDFFFRKNHLKTKVCRDTALSSLYISKKKINTKAAIASSLAAKAYKLYVRYTNIQSISNNFTIFLMIGIIQINIKKNFNKSSFIFGIKKFFSKKKLILLTFITYKNMNFIKIHLFINDYKKSLFYIEIIIDNYLFYEILKLKIKNQSYSFYIIGEYMNFLFF